METATLNVEGMACGGCANTVREALMAMPGVTDARISHVEGVAEVCYDPAQTGLQRLKAAIEKAGYPAR